MWGRVTIGGIPFREELSIEEKDNGLTIVGQESSPPSTSKHVRFSHSNVIGLKGRVVPVVFSDKSVRSGFYRVASVSSVLMDFSGGALVSATWRMDLVRIGSQRDVEFESRIPMIARTDDLPGSQVASFWHAPAASVSGYFTGSTTPAGSVVRTTDEGDLTVYVGIPTTVPPRWTAPADGYLIGSARILLDEVRVAGDDTPDHTTWEITNGIIRVRPQAANPGNLAVSMWRGVAGWSGEKVYRFQVGGQSISDQVAPEFTTIANEPEEVRVRLTYALSPGRTQVDLSLRRGARFVTGVLKRHAAANLGITRSAAETGSAFTGGIVAASADAEGVRYLLGSSKNPTSQTTATASITRNSVTQLDFFIGAVFTAPAANDAHTDLLLQYLGTLGDRTRVMER